MVGEAALNIAEQDYGYSLELSSFEIVDSFTAKADNLMSGDKITAKTFLVVLDAVAKDSAGTPVEEVTYGVVVVEPEKSDEHVTYNPMSNAQNCSGMSVEDVAEALKESTAHLR